NDLWQDFPGRGPIDLLFEFLGGVADFFELRPGLEIERRMLAIAVVVPIADVAGRGPFFRPFAQKLSDFTVAGLDWKLTKHLFRPRLDFLSGGENDHRQQKNDQDRESAAHGIFSMQPV